MAYTTSTGWLNPSVASSAGWTNQNNILASDDARSTIVVPAGAESATLRAYSFAGLSIPSTATITGIAVRVEGAITAGSVDYSYFFLGGANTGLPRSPSSKSVTLTATESVQTMGSSSDTWGGCDTNGDDVAERAWQPSDFSSDFMVYGAWGTTSGCTISIDSVQLQVWYSYGAAVTDELGLNVTRNGLPFVSVEAKQLSTASLDVTRNGLPFVGASPPGTVKTLAISFAEAEAYGAPLARFRPLVLTSGDGEAYAATLRRARPLSVAIPGAEAYALVASRGRSLAVTIPEVASYAASVTRSRSINLTSASVEDATTAGLRRRLTALDEAAAQAVAATIRRRCSTNLNLEEVTAAAAAVNRRHSVALDLQDSSAIQSDVRRQEETHVSGADLAFTSTVSIGLVSTPKKVEEPVQDTARPQFGTIKVARSGPDATVVKPTAPAPAPAPAKAAGEAAIARLKDVIQPVVEDDERIAAGLEAARLLLEQERLERLRREEEEELQLVMVMALAHRRRTRFKRVSV